MDKKTLISYTKTQSNIQNKEHIKLDFKSITHII